MVKMLTLSGKEVSRLRFNDLKREKIAQRYLLAVLKSNHTYLSAKNKAYHDKDAKEPNGYTRRSCEISDAKLGLIETYITHLEAMVEEIDRQMSRKSEPEDNAYGHKSRKSIRTQNAKKRQKVIEQAHTMRNWQDSSERDGLLVSWDRERFMLVAADNGYQTEEAVIYAVANELNLNRARAGALINRGRFTWGQVLCLGAMMEMTPKEFCDIFLAGYFVDKHGEYVADYENLSRQELLRRAIKPVGEEYMRNEVQVGADGKPLDEEEWVTD